MFYIKYYKYYYIRRKYCGWYTFLNRFFPHILNNFRYFSPSYLLILSWILFKKTSYSSKFKELKKMLVVLYFLSNIVLLRDRVLSYFCKSFWLYKGATVDFLLYNNLSSETLVTVSSFYSRIVSFCIVSRILERTPIAYGKIPMPFKD